MSAVSGVNLAMLPEDEMEFLIWLSTTGDIWATHYLDPSGEVRFKPLPVKEFRKRFGKRITQDNQLHLYLGHRDDVVKPVIHTVTVRSVIPSFKRREIDEQASQLICYRHGLVDEEQILERTSVYYYTSFLKGNTWVKKSPDWIKWARKVISWLKRQAAEEVPVYGCNDFVRATPLVKQATKSGLKVS